MHKTICSQETSTYQASSLVSDKIRNQPRRQACVGKDCSWTDGA